MLQPISEDDRLQRDLEEAFAKVSTADTGSSLDQDTSRYAELNDRLMLMTQQLQEQKAVMDRQANEIRVLRESRSAPPAPSVAPCGPVRDESQSEDESAPPPAPSGSSTDVKVPSFEAAKQRLRRKVRAGTVPTNVLEEWNKQGKTRTALINLFIEKDCDEEASVI